MRVHLGTQKIIQIVQGGGEIIFYIRSHNYFIKFHGLRAIVYAAGVFSLTWININLNMIDNYFHYKVRDAITLPLPNSKCSAVCEWISDICIYIHI